MKTNSICGWAGLIAGILLLAGGPETSAEYTETKCRMDFTLSSWSVFYKSSKGEGTITCENGQTATVKITAKGGGISFGKSKIADGAGVFSEVGDISVLFGSYGEAEAHAGVGADKSTGAHAMTKGKVSLALTGKGEGWNVGFAFGKFTIKPTGD